MAPRVGADVRLPRAIFRPVDIPGETGRIGYYLPETEETALAYEERRRVGAEDADPEEVSFYFGPFMHFLRRSIDLFWWNEIRHSILDMLEIMKLLLQEN